MKKLDRNKPVGHIKGYMGGYPGARFEQHGVYFDVAGREITKVDVPVVDGGSPMGMVPVTAPPTEADRKTAEFKAWVDELDGLEGRRDLAKYCKEIFGLTVARSTDLDALKIQAVAIYHAQASNPDVEFVESDD